MINYFSIISAACDNYFISIFYNYFSSLIFLIFLSYYFQLVLIEYHEMLRVSFIAKEYVRVPKKIGIK